MRSGSVVNFRVFSVESETEQSGQRVRRGETRPRAEAERSGRRVDVERFETASDGEQSNLSVFGDARGIAKEISGDGQSNDARRLRLESDSPLEERKGERTQDVRFSYKTGRHISAAQTNARFYEALFCCSNSNEHCACFENWIAKCWALRSENGQDANGVEGRKKSRERDS